MFGRPLGLCRSRGVCCVGALLLHRSMSSLVAITGSFKHMSEVGARGVGTPEISSSADSSAKTTGHRLNQSRGCPSFGLMFERHAERTLIDILQTTAAADSGVRPAPARSLIRRMFARTCSLRARIWAMLRFSGIGADSEGPHPIRLIGSGHALRGQNRSRRGGAGLARGPAQLF